MSWLSRLFFGAPKPPDRLIFRYRNGRQKMSADPVVLERGLVAAFGDEWWEPLLHLEDDPPVGLMGIQFDDWKRKQEGANRLVIETVSKVFRIPILQYHEGEGPEEGMTETQLKGVLVGFIRYCDDLITLARPFVKPRPMDSPALPSRPTPSGAASTSAAAASPTTATAS